MKAAYAHVKQALTGVVEILAGRPDFHGRFDVSPAGVVTSFGAAILAIPFTAFGALVDYALARAAAGQLDADPPASLTYVVVRWALIWIYFPVLAAVITTILNRRGSFAPWVVVQNWTHLFVVMIQLVPLALIAAGAPGIGLMLLMTTLVIIVYAYILAAKAALDVGWRLAVPCGAANLACTLLVDRVLQRLL